MSTTLCDPPVTHPSCDILAGKALGRHSRAGGGLSLLEGAAIAGSVWPGSQLPLGSLEPGRDGFLCLGPMETYGWFQGQRQEAVKDLQERPSPLALRTPHNFCSLPFFTPLYLG